MIKSRSLFPLLTTLVFLTTLFHTAPQASAMPKLSQEDLKKSIQLPAEVKQLPDQTDVTKRLEKTLEKMEIKQEGKFQTAAVEDDITFELEPNDSMDWADWLPLDNLGAGVFDYYDDLDFFEVDFPANGDVEIITASNVYADHVLPVALIVKPNGEVVNYQEAEMFADDQLKYIFETIPNVGAGTHYVVMLNAEDDYDLYEPYLFDIHFTEDEQGAGAFPDVEGTWAEPYVQFLVDQGLITGYPNGLFGVNDSITRAQAAAVIARELNLPLQKASFRDVRRDHWASDYIGAMEEEGYLTGYKDGTFKPGEFLTREEMASLLVRSYHLRGSANVDFPDVNRASWAYPSIETLVANNIVTGYPDGSFRPKAKIKRGEFAALMAKLLSDQY